MLELNSRGFFPYTPATNLLFGLRESLGMLREEGLENVFQRHYRLAEATRSETSASLTAFKGLLLRDLSVLLKNFGEFAGRTIIQPFMLVFVFLFVFPQIGQGVKIRLRPKGRRPRDPVSGRVRNGCRARTQAGGDVSPEIGRVAKEFEPTRRCLRDWGVPLRARQPAPSALP